MPARSASPRCVSAARLPSALAFSVVAAACGPSVAPVEAFAVVVAPTQDCTLTGATSRDCVDTAVLEQQRTRGRWILEHGANNGFTVTTEEGITLPGIHFVDDGREPAVAPTCQGEGGRCYFARRRFESTDENNNDCTRFGELLVILRRTEDGTITGLRSDTQGATETCGTSTTLERVDAVTGTLLPEAAAARDLDEASP